MFNPFLQKHHNKMDCLEQSNIRAFIGNFNKNLLVFIQGNSTLITEHFIIIIMCTLSDNQMVIYYIEYTLYNNIYYVCHKPILLRTKFIDNINRHPGEYPKDRETVR